MLLSSTPLRVIINPFSAPLSADGSACALVRTDIEHPNAIEYIGATLEVGKKARPKHPYGDKAVVRVRKYDLEPVDLDDTAYHRSKVKSGEAFASDDSTAARCGQKARTPEELRAALVGAACKAAAALPDVDIEPPWTAQGLGDFVPAAKKAQEKARAARAERIAAAEQAKRDAAPAAQRAAQEAANRATKEAPPKASVQKAGDA